MDTAKNFERRFIMALLCRLLVAQRAFIEELQSQIIELKNGGQIRSENFQENVSGFQLKSNGEFEAEQAKIRGDITAESGTFKGTVNATGGVLNGIVVEQTSRFKGSLDCDSLIVDYDPSAMKRFPTSGQYSNNTPASTIINDVYSWMGLSTATPIVFAVEDGYWYNPTYGGTIKAIEFYRATPANNVTGIRITTSWGTVSYSTGSGLWFRIGNGLKKIRLIDLPTAPGGTTGTVYKYQDSRFPGISFVAVKD